MRKVTISVTVFDTETGDKSTVQRVSTGFLIRQPGVAADIFKDVLTAAEQGMETLTEE